MWPSTWIGLLYLSRSAHEVAARSSPLSTVYCLLCRCVRQINMSCRTKEIAASTWTTQHLQLGRHNISNVNNTTTSASPIMLCAVESETTAAAGGGCDICLITSVTPTAFPLICEIFGRTENERNFSSTFKMITQTDGRFCLDASLCRCQAFVTELEWPMSEGSMYNEVVLVQHLSDYDKLSQWSTLQMYEI